MRGIERGIPCAVTAVSAPKYSLAACNANGGIALCETLPGGGRASWGYESTAKSGAAILVFLAGNGHLAEESGDGGGARAACGWDPLRRFRRLFATYGRGRGKNPGRPQRTPARIDRSVDRPAP